MSSREVPFAVVQVGSPILGDRPCSACWLITEGSGTCLSRNGAVPATEVCAPLDNFVIAALLSQFFNEILRSSEF